MIFVTQSVWRTRKTLVTFAILAKFADFSRPFFGFSLSTHKNFVKFVILAIFAIFVTQSF